MKLIFFVCLALLQLFGTSYTQLITPEVAYVSSNGSFTLTCPGALQWLKAVDNSLHPISDQDNQLLTLTGLQASEVSGDYYCITNTSSGISVSCPASVKNAYIEARPFLVTPSDKTVHVNMTAVLECSPPRSQPAAVVHWQLNGRDLSLEHPRYHVLPNGNLYIIQTQLADAGDYRCIAENPVTLEKRYSLNATLTVNSTELPPEAPSVTLVPQGTVLAAIGDSVLVECRTTGDPAAEIFWERLHSPIFPPNARVLPSGALLIGSLQSGDAGTYRCEAISDIGRGQQDVEIQITTVTTAPVFTAEPASAVSLDTAVRLTWTVVATGPLHVLFFHDGEQLDSILSREQVTFTTLVEPGSHGVYQLIAQSDHGCTRSSVVMATPSTVTTASAVPEESLTVFPDKAVQLKDKVLLVCIASQYSSVPEVVWLSPSGQVVRDVVRSDQAHIASAESPGVYSCRASWGDSIQTLNVTITPVPLAIQIGDHVTSLLGEMAELECVAEGTAVEIEWFKGLDSLGSGDLTRDENSRVVSRYSLPVVSEGSAGVYTCTARSPYSQGQLRAQLTLTVTIPEPVLGPPVNISLVNFNGGTFITWDPPTSTKPILGYKLNWGPVGGQVRQITRESTSEGEFYFPPHVLEANGGVVSVVLWAYTRDSEGEPVTITLPAPTEVPPCRTVFTSSGNATVILRPHTAQELTATCSRARVTTVIQLPPGAESADLTELLPNCDYRFEATNQNGELVSCDLETPNDQVNIFANVTRFVNGSVSVHWLLPLPLHSQPGLVIELDWGSGWVGVVSGEHLPLSLEPHQEYNIQLRLSLHNWTGVSNITVPAVPSEVHRSIQIAILYGAICGGVILICCLVLLVILSLKLVQYRRREENKTSDKKEKDRAIFRRMSMERASMNSIKRPTEKPHNHSTDV